MARLIDWANLSRSLLHDVRRSPTLQPWPLNRRPQAIGSNNLIASAISAMFFKMNSRGDLKRVIRKNMALIFRYTNVCSH